MTKTRDAKWNIYFDGQLLVPVANSLYPCQLSKQNKK